MILDKRVFIGAAAVVLAGVSCFLLWPWERKFFDLPVEIV